MAEHKVSRYVVAVDVLRPVTKLVFSTRTGAIIFMATEIWDKVTQLRLCDVPQQIIDELVAGKVLVASAADELAEILHENDQAALGLTTLNQVIQPSAFCQMSCGYCGQAHSKRTISETDQKRLISRLDEKLALGSYQALHIGWFGAEPLLAMGVLRSLTPRLAEVAVSRGARYSAKLVTNGMLLTKAIATELVTEHAVTDIEVTLDGLASEHDLRRPTKSGRGTFSRVIRNVEDVVLADLPGLQFIVRCNVDHDNAAGVIPLIDKIADLGIQDRLSFYVAPVHSWGNDADKASLTLDQFAEMEMEWFARMYVRGYRMRLLPSRKPVVCLALQREGEMMDAYGETFNCTEVSYVPAYGTPNKYRLSAKEGRAFNDFNSMISSKIKLPCSDCAILPACGGACPKLWLEGKSPCPPIKRNLPERLSLWHATKVLDKVGGA